MKETEELIRSLRKILEGGFLVIVGMVFSKIVYYFYRILMARGLGPEEYGTFSLAFSIFMVSIVISNFGVPAALNRFVSKNLGLEKPQRVREIIFSSFKINFTLSFFIGSLILVIAPFIADLLNETGLVIPLRIFAIMLPLRIFLGNITSIFKAYQKIGYFEGIENIFQPFVLLITSLIVFSFGGGLVELLGAYLISIFLSSLTGFFILQKKVISVFGERKGNSLNEIMRFSFPIYGASLASAFNLNISNFLMGWHASVQTADIGVFNAASPTAHLITGITPLFSVLILPIVSNYFARGKEDDANLLTSMATRWSVVFLLPIVFVLILFSDLILNTLFGSKYISAQYVLVLLSIGLMFDGFVNPLSKNLVARDKTIWIFGNNLTSLALNAVLAYVLIPLYGIFGAALAYSISLILRSILVYVEAEFILGLRPVISNVKIPVILSVILFPPFYVIKQVLHFLPDILLIISGTTFFFTVYLTGVFLFEGLKEEEKALLEDMKGDISLFNR